MRESNPKITLTHMQVDTQTHSKSPQIFFRFVGTEHLNQNYKLIKWES